LQKTTDENIWGETVITILIYSKFLFQIFVRNVNMWHLDPIAQDILCNAGNIFY